jgi:hypothetical protein
MWAILINSCFFMGIVVVLSRWKRMGTLTADRFAVMTSSFWSFLDFSFVLAYANLTWKTILVGIILAILQFALAYPISSWIFRKIF